LKGWKPLYKYTRPHGKFEGTSYVFQSPDKGGWYQLVARSNLPKLVREILEHDESLEKLQPMMDQSVKRHAGLLASGYQPLTSKLTGVEWTAITMSRLNGPAGSKVIACVPVTYQNNQDKNKKESVKLYGDTSFFKRLFENVKLRLSESKALLSNPSTSISNVPLPAAHVDQLAEVLYNKLIQHTQDDPELVNGLSKKIGAKSKTRTITEQKSKTNEERLRGLITEMLKQ
jgi:hypothetical protein